MKKQVLTGCLAVWAGLVSAQVATSSPQLPSVSEPNYPAVLAPVQNLPHQGPPVALNLGGCTNVDSLSTSSNMFTMILTEANPIAVNNETNTMVFVHRNNAGAFGGHSGQIRYDISTNGGTSWTSNLGPLNPASVNGTNGARYPNVAIYNPAGNTNPNNAYLAHYSATVAAAFNGHVSGVRKLDGTGNTESYNQAVATQTLIPRSLVNGAPGVMWSVDAVYNGTIVTGYRTLKGVWNGTSDFVWSVNNTFTPPFNTTYDGSPKTSDFNIAFDPTGMYGWVCILGHINTGGSAYSMYPIFYNTTDGGATWSGPTQVDITQFPCIYNNIAGGNFASLAFDMDLTVDVNGNPHALVTAANGNNAYAVFFTSWHAMFDITLDHGVWNAVWVADAYRGRGTWGVAPNSVTQDLEAQISRSADGTKLFYFWTDADSNNVNANQQPNLRGRAYDVVNRSWTTMQEFTECNATFNGKAMFPKAAPTALNISGGHEVPIAMARFLTVGLDPAVATSLQYLDSVGFMNNEYTIPQCSLPVSISANDTIVTCSSVVLNAGTGEFFKWNSGATTSTITASTSGWYSVAVNSGCCVGWDSVYVQVESVPVAIFGVQNSGLNYTFNDLSTGNPTSWAWNFGDGNSSTLPSPSHTFASSGTFNVCLTVTNACSTSTACQNFVVTCPAPVAAFGYTTTGLDANFSDQSGTTPTAIFWDFGDGNTSAANNPSHTYSAAGNYLVCMTVVDACGQDSVCQTLVVCEPMNADWVVTLGTGPTFGFVDSTSGSPTTWFWDFGDGNTSNVPSPGHTYAQAGLYQVCLVVTNACESDTFCGQINSVVGGMEDLLGQSMQAFPNPATQLLQISIEELTAGEMSIQLFNLVGQSCLLEDQIHVGGAFRSVVDVSELPRGTYLLRVTTASGAQERRLIVLE